MTLQINIEALQRDIIWNVPKLTIESLQREYNWESCC